MMVNSVANGNTQKDHNTVCKITHINLKHLI